MGPLGIAQRARCLCHKCGSYKTKEKIETFKNHSVHVRMECGKCGKFLKWQPHDLVDVNQV